MTINILIAEDDQPLRQSLAKALTHQGYAIQEASNGPEAVHKIQEESFQLVLADLSLPDVPGIEILEKAKQKDPNTQVIMMTGAGNIANAVDSMRRGASDFLQKPIEWDTLLASIGRALDRNELQHMVAVYRASQYITRSQPLDDLLPSIARLCRPLLNADDILIALYNKQRSLEVVATAGVPQSACKEECLAFARQYMVDAGAKAEPILLRDAARSPLLQTIPCYSHIYSTILYPLVFKGTILGVIQLNRTQTRISFTTFDLRCVAIFSAQIAQAVQNAFLYAELQEKVAQLEKANRTIEEAQQKLIQSEKLAAMGTLAAGVAHELNNPMTAILGYTQILLDSNNLSAQQREDLETVETQSRRCRTIIHNLLDFSRVKKPALDCAEITPLIRSTLHLVMHDFSISGVELSFLPEPSLPRVIVDAHQVQQVLLNLLTNARHAIEHRPKKIISIHAYTRDAHVYIDVRDTGCGIAPEVLSKIFDPFFTTKPTGKGTGLGLSICQSIMSQHHGGLTVVSEVGVGSTFTLEFPAATDDANPVVSTGSIAVPGGLHA